MSEAAVDRGGAVSVSLEQVAGGAEEVFARHHGDLVRLARFLAGPGATGEDAVAEVFARSWPALEHGRVRDPVAYLRRSLVRELHRQSRWWHRQALAVAADSDSDADLATAAADRELVAGLLGLLPARQREVLVLRYLEDWSEPDTAKLLGITVGAVKRHAHRGLARLRREWSSDDRD